LHDKGANAQENYIETIRGVVTPEEKKHFCIRIFSLSVIPFFLPIINFGFLYQYDLGKRELQRVINENHK
jgi:hypothetical protein